jgi:predicted amidohydrolase YtcJ
LDRNLLTADAERIPATQVLKTFVGGRLLYEK